MTLPSPFERVAKLPALAAFCARAAQTAAGSSEGRTSGEGKLRHDAVAGLLGAARSLAVGAAARGRAGNAQGAPASVVLAVVEGPDEADDLIADLRAFQSAAEAARAHEMRRTPLNSAPADTDKGGEAKPDAPSKRKKSKSPNPQSEARTPQSEDWADHTLPATATLPDDLKARLPLETLVFPAWDVLPTETDRPEGAALAGRGRVLDRIAALAGAGGTPEALVLVAPVASLMQPCEPPGDPGERIVLRAGGTWDPIALGRRLAEAGFERTGQVEVRGEYSLRGGILDVYPFSTEHPCRVEFFDDRIESIAHFDPMMQRNEEPVESVEILDASPKRLRKLFSPGAGPGPFTLLDHLPPGTAVLWLDPKTLARRAELYAASLVSGRSLHVPFDELRARAEARFDTLALHAAAGEDRVRRDGDADVEDYPLDDEPIRDDEGDGDGRIPRVACTSLQRLQGEISPRALAWKKLAASRMALYVFCETPGDLKRLETLLSDAGVLPAPAVQLRIGRISSGFDLRGAGLAATSDREILGRRKHAAAESSARRRKIPPDARPLAGLFELNLGDYVVHAQHGIARYLGLSRLEKSGRMEDYLTLQFADDVKLYVPAAHIHWVSRYVGSSANLELSKIGGKTWARKKARAQSAIRDLAEDLLKVQAARRSRPGIVYGPDTEWQGAFENSFPYDETDDQLSAIASVKRDMQATWPMDRLLCGDVGFGKTEVAVRAAFKAVCAGKQVAVLVPTTLLCEQHGRTFKERFAGYPVSVETLSRFKSRQQQKGILQRLAVGRLDVIIGTHRVLQKDVHFNDLGLAIVDEEQRFGVEHKEFFKNLRHSVDVLTLTATPIPRTLHMALLGLRDISNLATPPRNRRSIHTKVARVSDDLLRRAILREISRGGQVFVVHPRVHDLEEFRARLAELVPEARFATGHGQMDGDELEAVMDLFLRREIDVLVSTTIVESGLDIPTANTMLVHEADRFGLAELHQLRGRVGRSDIQAYCYLLLPEKSALTPEGLRRLRALEEFDDLGAGFQIALKDLEIRGAGNVLGGEQSGWIAEVGYDLYCRLLDATVKELRGQPPEAEPLEVNLQLRGAAFLPETYIEDPKAVLEVYRRLDDARGPKQIDALREEVKERFGPLPEAAGRLFEEAKLRLEASAASVPYIGIEPEEGRLVFKFFGWDMKSIDRALRGLPELKGVRVVDETTLSFGLPLKAKHDEAALHGFVRGLLEPLAERLQRHGAKAAMPVAHEP
ncbi:MAG: transcription-repair coupling factor [Planctomycetes bacterium]|nr:transcription-repair coupling factor [Planctomycetota bacterium]